MAYRFDRDFASQDINQPMTSDYIDDLFSDGTQGAQRNAGYQGNSGYQTPRVDERDFGTRTQDNIDVETWKYGEGEFDYLANDPNYGNHGNAVAASSGRKPWVHYFIIDNIKYIVLMVVFFFLFMARLDNLGIEGVELQTIKGEVLACYIGLTSLLFFKSLWRLYKMR